MHVTFTDFAQFSTFASALPLFGSFFASFAYHTTTDHRQQISSICVVQLSEARAIKVGSQSYLHSSSW